MKTYKKKSKGKWRGGLFWIGGISVYEIGIEADPSFLEGLDTDYSISGLILFTNSSYNLCFFT